MANIPMFCYDLYSEIKITVIIVVFVVFVAVVISRPNSRSGYVTVFQLALIPVV